MLFSCPNAQRPCHNLAALFVLLQLSGLWGWERGGKRRSFLRPNMIVVTNIYLVVLDGIECYYNFFSEGDRELTTTSSTQRTEHFIWYTTHYCYCLDHNTCYTLRTRAYKLSFVIKPRVNIRSMTLSTPSLTNGNNRVPTFKNGFLLRLLQQENNHFWTIDSERPKIKYKSIETLANEQPLTEAWCSIRQ